MKTKHSILGLILSLTLGMTIQQAALAQQNAQTESHYSDPNAAQHASHLAAAEANSTDPTLQESLNRITMARQQNQKMKNVGSQGQAMSNNASMKNAEDGFVSMTSRMSGVSESDIRGMHASGIDWSDIPGELGIHMSSTSTGKMGNVGSQMNKGTGMTGGTGMTNSGSMMASQSEEMMGATARNTKSGWSQGHGAGLQTNMSDNKTHTQGSNKDGKMMSGAGGMANGMSSTDTAGNNSGMGGGAGMGAGNSGGAGGMGGSGSGSSSGGMGGSGSGGMGGSGGGMGGGSGSGGSGGGTGGGSGGSGGGGGGMH